MEARQLFIDVVTTATEAPALLAAHAAEVRDCETRAFDESYIEFLDEQIRLGPRGPEWTRRLMRRRAGLSPYCNVTLIRGSVRSPGSDYTVYVDPNERRIVYVEGYEPDDPIRPEEVIPPWPL